MNPKYSIGMTVYYVSNNSIDYGIINKIVSLADGDNYYTIDGFVYKEDQIIKEKESIFDYIY